MHNRNVRFDPKDRPNSTTQGGVSVPVKGDSSPSHAPIDPDATLIEFPAPVSDPDATVVEFRKPVSDPEATLVDVSATQADTAPPRGTAARPPARVQVTVPVFEEGDVLGGRYEILKLLGEGGMGAVYKALDRELNRPVALKIIRPELAANPSILARFKQELLLARQVTHKNVIRIYDLGDADGVKFITMEFVEGEDLRGLIKEKK
jgi:eukaryotic-like serine/threonine-protein kinase